MFDMSDWKQEVPQEEKKLEVVYLGILFHPTLSRPEVVHILIKGKTKLLCGREPKETHATFPLVMIEPTCEECIAEYKKLISPIGDV